MKPMMKVIQSAYIEQKDCENALQEVLFTYRVTQFSPTDLKYSRHIDAIYQTYPIKSTLNPCKGLYCKMIVLEIKVDRVYNRKTST